MKFRNVESFYELALDNTGTKPIDLKTQDPISAIRLDFKGTNGATNNQENWMNDVVTKIEIVDGSERLISLSLKHGQALQFFNTKRTPWMRCEERGGGSYNEQVLIQFGRYLWDPEYYLDLTKFDNPQLRITTDEDAIRDLGATGFLTGTFKVTVNLHVIEEGAAPAKGFIMQKEIYSFTAATSGDEHVNLPHDYPIAGILLRAFYTQNDFDETLSRLKISCDTDKFVPVDKKCADLLRMNEEDYGAAELRMQLDRTSGDTVKHPLFKDPVAVLQGDEASHIYQAIYQWSGYFDLTVINHAGSAVTSDNWIRCVIKGGSLHSTLYVPFGRLEDPDSYFNVKDWEDVELILTQACPAGELGSVEIVLQQLRSYAAV